MEQNTQQNPLKQYFRQIKFYIKLPSGTHYYSKEMVDFNANGEIGVLPMTGKDELALKNPDGLLNGESLVEVINSCVPSVKNVRNLLSNDIDALITAIKYATFDNNIETNLNCPSCSHTNSFKLDIGYALDNMSFLENEYPINLDSGITVFVRPYAFPEVLKGLHAQFERSKIERTIENGNITDAERLNIFAKAFKDLSTLTFELLLNTVIKVVDEGNNVDVTNREHISEFLFNIDKTSIDKIANTVTEINTIGIKKSFTAKCEKCNHEWESEIDFNPVNFS